MTGRKSLAAIAVLAGSLAFTPARAETVTDFYKGKTIRVVTGAGVGGSYAVYAQLASRHLGRFIPGSPTVVMQSMPGVSGP